ncbi:MAG: outer membrane beta-barrel protein, partial [Rhodanobacter sp.]
TFKGHSYTETLRVGYRWDIGAFSYGLEAGYANLGHSYYFTGHNTGFDQYSERIDGPLLGASLKYALPLGFFISGRGGFFRPTDHQIDQSTHWIIGLPLGPYAHSTARENPSGTGSYVGVGLGYDFNTSFGVGLNYDRYRAHVVTNYQEILFSVTPRVDAYTFTAEYRF